MLQTLLKGHCAACGINFNMIIENPTSKCPYCGYMLSEDDIDECKSVFIANPQLQIADYITSLHISPD